MCQHHGRCFSLAVVIQYKWFYEYKFPEVCSEWWRVSVMCHCAPLMYKKVTHWMNTWHFITLITEVMTRSWLSLSWAQKDTEMLQIVVWNECLPASQLTRSVVRNLAKLYFYVLIVDAVGLYEGSHVFSLSQKLMNNWTSVRGWLCVFLMMKNCSECTQILF